jgi:drug/metabolite transporter (DMT)-like permease
LFTVMGVIWGMPYLLIKIADAGVSVAVLVFARVLAGSLLLLPVAIRRGRLSALRPYLRWLAAFAAVEVILPWPLLSGAERSLSSSLSGLLIAAVPVIGVGVARLAGDRERLSAARWAGLAIGLSGVALLGGRISSGGAGWPVLEVLGTALCYAIGPVIAARKLAGADDLGVTAMSLALAAVVYAPAAALTWPRVLPSARVLGALAGLAVVCTALAFVLYFRLIAEAGPVRATVITYVNPAVAVALGAAVLGEPITPAIVISFALILAGSVLATGSPGNRLRSLSRSGSAEQVADGGDACGDGALAEVAEAEYQLRWAGGAGRAVSAHAVKTNRPGTCRGDNGLLGRRLGQMRDRVEAGRQSGQADPGSVQAKGIHKRLPPPRVRAAHAAQVPVESPGLDQPRQGQLVKNR